MITCGTTEENCKLVSPDAVSSGKDSTEQTLCQQFDWKGLLTIVRGVCKKCPTCQREKTTNQKYGKIPPRQAETIPWDTLYVDLIGPYTIPRKRKTRLNRGALQ